MLSIQLESAQNMLLKNKYYAITFDKSLQNNTYEYSRAYGLILSEFINSLKNEFNNQNLNFSSNDLCILNNYVFNAFNHNCNNLEDCNITQHQKESFYNVNNISDFGKSIISHYCSIVLSKSSNYSSIDFYKFKCTFLLVKCLSFYKKNSDVKFYNNFNNLLVNINYKYDYNCDIFYMVTQIISNISNNSNINNKISIYNNIINFLIPINNDIIDDIQNNNNAIINNSINNNNIKPNNNINLNNKINTNDKIDFSNYTVMGLKELCRQKKLDFSGCYRRDEYIKLLSK